MMTTQMTTSKTPAFSRIHLFMSAMCIETRSSCNQSIARRLTRNAAL